ncbi:MAG TPA: hypothetical protein VK665_08855 [Candidatus Elarobacter sp.]|nr:hypothetical protein [Candidatus Elarobacter sp.]
MTVKRYALYALETLLGQPENLTRERDGDAAGVEAAWDCGCVAQGRTTAALEIRPCASHGALFEGE